MKLVVKESCKICNKPFVGNGSLTAHILGAHDLKIKDYYDRYFKKSSEGKCTVCGKETKFINLEKGYRTYCSVSCSKKDAKDNNNTKQCAICGDVIYGKNVFISAKKFLEHIRLAHNYESFKDYYDENIKKEDEGKCLICGKETAFDNHNGYRKFCSNKCASKDRIKQSKINIKEKEKIDKEENIALEKKRISIEEYKKELKNRVKMFEGNQGTYYRTESDMFSSFNDENTLENGIVSSYDEENFGGYFLT